MPNYGFVMIRTYSHVHHEKPRIWKFKLVHLTGKNDMFQVCMFQRYRFRVRPPQVDNDSISKSVKGID